jgi:hypothetical protein
MTLHNITQHNTTQHKTTQHKQHNTTPHDAPLWVVVVSMRCPLIHIVFA